MIITEQKSFEKILESLTGLNNILIVGCGTCSTTCQTGGEKQVKEMKTKLIKAGKKIVGTLIIESPCDERLTRRDLAKAEKELTDSDAILVMSCGVGVQVVGSKSEKKVVPALNTLFLGKTKSIGRFYERCVLCGDCILDKTEGICPVARCSKRLLNGPCGGTDNGKCEVHPDYECAWYMIYERLKKKGKVDELRKILTPKDYSKVIRPRIMEIQK